MACMSDVRDILDVDGPTGVTSGDTPLTMESLLNADQKKKKPKKPKNVEGKMLRPEGMHRELFALLYSNDKKEIPPIVPTSTSGKHGGYKSAKAKLGLRKVRRWKWTRFINPARQDNFALSHWRREEDGDKEYPFAKFNKVLEVPVYTDAEYAKVLEADEWSREETDHLMELAKRFDLRWPIMVDRWDRSRFNTKRSIEDAKERYYGIHNALAKLRATDGQEPHLLHFDADHERRRKEQLEKLYSRTEAQIEEEQYLYEELRKIEARRKERERKAADLQKLIAAADTADSRGAAGAQQGVTPSGSAQQSGPPLTPTVPMGADRKKKHPKPGRPSNMAMSAVNPGGESASSLESTSGIKFSEIRGPGVYLRSQRMKLPANLGQKKIKTIEEVLKELGLDSVVVSSEDIAVHFNELRSDVLLLYECRMALASCQYELESLRHQYQTLTGQELTIPSHLRITDESAALTESQKGAADSASGRKRISEVIDMAGGGLSQRKRKVAVETPTTSDMVKRLRRS